MGTANTDPFKKCSHCGVWLSKDDFVNSVGLRPIGISFIDGDISMACYYFQHDTDNCGTCLVVPVVAFESYIEENIPATAMTFQEGCEHHCVSLDDLAVCRQPCMFAPYRRFLIKMMATKKTFVVAFPVIHTIKS